MRHKQLQKKTLGFLVKSYHEQIFHNDGENYYIERNHLLDISRTSPLAAIFTTDEYVKLLFFSHCLVKDVEKTDSALLGVKGRAKVSRSKSQLHKTFSGQDSMGSLGGVVW